eukprot:174045-Rhodomonas_salina.1
MEEGGGLKEEVFGEYTTSGGLSLRAVCFSSPTLERSGHVCECPASSPGIAQHSLIQGGSCSLPRALLTRHSLDSSVSARDP